MLRCDGWNPLLARFIAMSSLATGSLALTLAWNDVQRPRWQVAQEPTTQGFSEFERKVRDLEDRLEREGARRELGFTGARVPAARVFPRTTERDAATHLSVAERLERAREQLDDLEEVIALEPRLADVADRGSSTLADRLFTARYYLDQIRLSTDPQIRSRAFFRLACTPGGESFMATLTSDWLQVAFGSSDPACTWHLAAAARDLPRDDSVRSMLLVWARESPDESTRRLSIKSLGTYGTDPIVRTSLERALGDPSLAVRESAAEVLEELEFLGRVKVDDPGDVK